MGTRVGFLSENKAEGWEGVVLDSQRNLVHCFESLGKWKDATCSFTHSLKPNTPVSHS